MAFQWSQLKLVETMEKLNSFIKLSGVDDNLADIERAMERCKLDEKTRKEYRTAKEVAQILWDKTRFLHEVRVVIAWRNPDDVTHPVTLQVEYLGRKSGSVSKV
jgi:hypothetical protein